MVSRSDVVAEEVKNLTAHTLIPLPLGIENGSNEPFCGPCASKAVCFNLFAVGKPSSSCILCSFRILAIVTVVIFSTPSLGVCTGVCTGVSHEL